MTMLKNKVYKLKANPNLLYINRGDLFFLFDKISPSGLFIGFTPKGIYRYYTELGSFYTQMQKGIPKFKLLQTDILDIDKSWLEL